MDLIAVNDTKCMMMSQQICDMNSYKARKCAILALSEQGKICDGVGRLISILGRCANNQNGNLRWHLPLGVRPPPPPPLWHKFPDIFYSHFFYFAVESYIYETDFTLGLSQKYHF